jgi:translation initiation factor IF-2
MSLSDKVRIHDFAKQYGMTGKDLAAKLRDFGFSKARSHMSALDPFDLVTAQGVLEANGIMPVGEGSPSTESSTGGLKVVKRLKKSASDEEDAHVVEPAIDHGLESTGDAGVEPAGWDEPQDAAPSVQVPSGPEAASQAHAAPNTGHQELPSSAEANVAANSAGSSTGSPAGGPGSSNEATSANRADTHTDAGHSVPSQESSPGISGGIASDGSTSVSGAPIVPRTDGQGAQSTTAEAPTAPTPTGEAPTGDAPSGAAAASATPAQAHSSAEPGNPASTAPVTDSAAMGSSSPVGSPTATGASAGKESPASEGTPSAAGTPSAPGRPQAAPTPAPRPSRDAAGAPHRSEAPSTVGRTPAPGASAPRPGSMQPPRPVGPPAGGSGAVLTPAQKPTTPGRNDPKDPPRRGNVVGFVDPSTFQQAPQKKRASSRRLQSRDEAAPDVRPTLGGRRAGGPASPQPSASGPRGKLTAAELREREQNRFLRHNRTSQTGHVQGRRAGTGRRNDNVTESPYAGGSVDIAEPVTIAKLADTLALKANLLIGKAMSSGLGLFNINQTIDVETATLIAAEFEVELEVKEDITAEQAHLEEVRSKRSKLEEEELQPRSPTVAFLGHVDHGKTTLIDKIRSTRVAQGESGGITQHVGAYRVITSKGHPVTIIDTPGHEAFTSMRARGARAVDIVVLVVAGDDGVKPSTVEAINHAKVAKTPIVVAINKKDKADFNPNAVIQQLMGHELVPEQYGGNTAMFHTSGMTGEGIDELLEHIFLMGDIELGLKAHPTGPASGVVLEAEIQQGLGVVAHLLVQDGTLNRGDVILAGSGYGKVRQILDDRSKPLQEAGPSMPVAVTGLDALPGVGDTFYVVDSLAKAKQIALERERANRAKSLADARDPRKQLEALLGREAGTEAKILNLIVRADVQGTAEVIKSEIAKMGHDEVELKVIHSGVGPVTESDVDLATPSQALLIAFKVGVNGKARQNADRANVEIKRYEVIYELLDDLRLLMEGALRPEFEEIITGHVEIRALFKSSRIGLIAGCMVLDGVIKRNSLVRLIRDGSVVYTGTIGSLRREKDDAREVREGFECGIVLKDYRDIQTGDIIECYEMKEIKRTL